MGLQSKASASAIIWLRKAQHSIAYIRRTTPILHMRPILHMLSALFLPMAVLAQKSPVKQPLPDYYAGLRVGYNHARLGPQTRDAHDGVFAGGFFSFAISEYWRTKTEFQVSTHGARYAFVNRVNDLRMTSIALPITLQYFPKKTGPFVELGIQPMGVVRTKFNNSVAYVLRDRFWVSDVELLGGAGYMFNKHLGVTARYIYGLKDLSRSLTVSTEPIRNRIIQVGVILNVDAF